MEDSEFLCSCRVTKMMGKEKKEERSQTQFLPTEAPPLTHHKVFSFPPLVKPVFVFCEYQHLLRSKSRLTHPWQCLEHVCVCMELTVNILIINLYYLITACCVTEVWGTLRDWWSMGGQSLDSPDLASGQCVAHRCRHRGLILFGWVLDLRRTLHRWTDGQMPPSISAFISMWAGKFITLKYYYSQSLKSVGFFNLEACHTHTNNYFCRG